MKRIIATIGLLCVGLSGAGHETNAQVTINIFNLNDVLRAKPIDETRFTVQYQTTSMPDTLQPDKKEEEDPHAEGRGINAPFTIVTPNSSPIPY